MNRPVLGIIMLDTQFPRIKGDIGNPETFDFEVIYERVDGATATRVVKEADPALLAPFIAAAKKLEQRGAQMIATSCGFLAMYQQELNTAVDVPVFASSLLQLKTASALFSSTGKKVGVITICEKNLTPRHFSGVDACFDEHHIIGMPTDSLFYSTFMGDKLTLDEEQCTLEMAETAKRFVEANPDIGALVLECTNMPPYSSAIREKTGLPVFDVVTMLNHAQQVLVS